MRKQSLMSWSAGVVGVALAAAPVMGQDASGTAARLAAIAAELSSLREQNDRLQAEVEYLKSNALAERKELATQAVTVAALNSTASVATARYAWSGDMRMRREIIDQEENVGNRTRDRFRLRFGVTARVTDTINGRVQFSSINTGNDIARSTNQTMGSSWDRKSLGIEMAYLDWRARSSLNVVIGKQPIPWTTTVSYFFDKDLTPEGVALKYSRGSAFVNAAYTSLNERDSATNGPAARDAHMTMAQVGLRKTSGRFTWTAAAAMFNSTGVRDRIVSGAGTGCAIDGAFGGGQGTGNNAFGNTTYSGAAPQVGSATVCTRLLNEYEQVNLLGQLDFTAGKYPISLFVDYMKNDGVLSTVTNKQDTGLSAGFQFNRAAAARSWEIAYVYQRTEKDAVFGQFHDSDYNGGQTDNQGGLLRLAYVPVAGWTLNAQYGMSKRFVDPLDAVITRDYDRLQLDLNYRF